MYRIIDTILQIVQGLNMLSKIQLPLPIHFINCNMFMPGASSIMYLSNNKFLVLSFDGFVERDNLIIAVRT